MNDSAKKRPMATVNQFKDDLDEFIGAFFKALGVTKTKQTEEKIESVKQKIVDFYRKTNFNQPTEQFHDDLKKRLGDLEQSISDEVSQIIGKPDKPRPVDMESILKTFKSAKVASTKIRH